MSIRPRTNRPAAARGGPGRGWLGCLLTLTAFAPALSRADTVASLLGNFTINQFCDLTLSPANAHVHYAVVFGQLPALRELHLADADGDGVTTQAERDAYVGQLAPGLADGLVVEVDGVAVPLRAQKWTSSLPTEQGGFSLRVDVDFHGALPPPALGARRQVAFSNHNFPGRIGWHEIVVQAASGIEVYDTNAFSTSLTGGLTQALQSLPAAGPLDERAVQLRYTLGVAPADAVRLAARPGAAAISAPAVRGMAGTEAAWIAGETRRLVDAISAPHLAPRVAMLVLLGALLLGAVHALSPGHGKTIVGAYLIGSRGTPRHAVFLGLTVTVTHTVGVFVLGFATLFASRFIVPERLFPILSLISAVLVLGMGVVLLVQRARAARWAPWRSIAAPPTVFHPLQTAAAGATAGRGFVFARTHEHTHSHADGVMHSHGGGMHSHLPPVGETISWRSLLALGISGGLVPCPSALVLLLAAVALNKTAYGMLLVGAFSVGLAITLTAVGLAFLHARNRFRKPGATARWTQLLPVLSAATITVLGVVLCVGALKSFGT